MRAYIQGRYGQPATTSGYCAYLGFTDMGIETTIFSSIDELEQANREDIVVGGIGVVKARLRNIGVSCHEINYPEELQRFLGRRIWPSTIERVNNGLEPWPVFVKPVEGKRFTGCVVRGISDLVGKGCCGDNFSVICSDVLDIASEYRCFVRRGEILDVRRYRGRWDVAPDKNVITDAIASYATAPAGYAADFGVTKDGQTVLIEINDGYSLGSYGLWHDLYAQLLSARWSELTETPDPCNFGLPVPAI